MKGGRMRLIDADKLIAEYDRVHIGEPGGARKLMVDAPTIEERKKGEWIVTSEFEDCRYAKCNQCKVTQVFYYNKQLTNFCPNCGADMRGGRK